MARVYIYMAGHLSKKFMTANGKTKDELPASTGEKKKEGHEEKRNTNAIDAPTTYLAGGGGAGVSPLPSSPIVHCPLPTVPLSVAYTEL